MEHYFSPKQTSELKRRDIVAILRATEFMFITGSGVFSPRKVDKGSELLINKCIIDKKTKSVLDLGCGYGPVGIAIAKLFPTVKVTMTDINERAVALAKKNAKLNKVTENTKIKKSNIYQNLVGEKFDTILLNPPQSAGKKLCLKMIEEAKDHLNNNGTLQIVARHKKGGKSLSEHMQDIFGNVEVVSRGSGYRIYLSKLLLE